MCEERLMEHLLAGGVEPRRLAGVHRRRRLTRQVLGLEYLHHGIRCK